MNPVEVLTALHPLRTHPDVAANALLKAGHLEPARYERFMLGLKTIIAQCEKPKAGPKPVQASLLEVPPINPGTTYNSPVQGDITYSQNWNNKLYCLSWTTIRLASDFYIKGRVYNQWLAERGKERKLIGVATIVNIESFRLEHLTEGAALLDTGYGKAQTQKLIQTMYKSRNLNWDTQLLYRIFLLKI